MAKYLKILQISVLHSIQGAKALFGLTLFLVVCMVILANLWRVIGHNSMTHAEIVWYIAFNEWVMISLPRADREIEIDYRTGRLAYLLPRPVSYITHLFFETLGTLFVNLTVLGCAAYLITTYLVGPLNASFGEWVALILTGIGAGCLGLLFHMIVGLSSFWIYDIEPITWIWEKCMIALGGLIMPLSIYPKAIETIIYLTPFPYLLGERSKIALGGSILAPILGLILWAGLALLLLSFLYRRGLKILHVEGG